MPEKRRRENNENTHDKKHMAYKTFTRSNGTVWIEARNVATGKRQWVRIR
jgi:hypothetical protein